MTFHQKLKDYIENELFADGTEVELDSNLLADGMVDSLGMLKLVAFIEEQTGVKIDPGHLTAANFRNINVIAAFTATLKPNPPSSAA